MKKKQIIQEIVGTALEPYGFKFFKTDGQLHTFVRVVTGVKRYYDPANNTVRQYVDIQEHRFDKALRVWLSTDVYCGGGEAIEEISWINYSDEESYRKALVCLFDAVVKYGMDRLQKISIEDEIIPTKAMADELFLRHKELDKLFVDEYHFKAVPETEEDIDIWYENIEKILFAEAERSYDDVKDLIVKISAFIGERACQLLSEEWKFLEDMKEPIVEDKKHKNPSFFPLMTVVKIWKSRADGTCSWTINRQKEVFKKVLC